MRLAYLGVTNVFALLRLLPMSSRDKDAEILVLRHQLSVLQRQLGPDRVRLTPGDRALLAGAAVVETGELHAPVVREGLGEGVEGGLEERQVAALLHQIPRDVVNRLHLVVRPPMT